MKFMFKLVKILIKLLKPLIKLGLFDGIIEDLVSNLAEEYSIAL